MASRINRAIELLAQDQAIYYDGAHTGHVLTHAQGREDAGNWADYINVGMEHGAFDMTGLADYMRGLVDGGPTRSGHRTPTIIVEAPVNGTDEANVRFNAWQFRQILGRGAHDDADVIADCAWKVAHSEPRRLGHEFQALFHPPVDIDVAAWMAEIDLVGVGHHMANRRGALLDDRVDRYGAPRFWRARRLEILDRPR